MAKRHILSCLVLLACLCAPAGAMAEGLLDSTVLRRDDIRAFTKWTGMLARFRAARPSAGRDCPPSPLMPCPAQDWQAMVDGLRGQDILTQIEAVNSRVNQALYVGDMSNWGVADYWATPFEFMAKDGDCEDYAIAKYLTLKSLGVNPAAMRIVVVDDLDLGVPHAVLTVQAAGRTLVLDNRVAQVVDAGAVHHYRAIYSINEAGWWLHHPPQ